MLRHTKFIPYFQRAVCQKSVSIVYHAYGSWRVPKVPRRPSTPHALNSRYKHATEGTATLRQDTKYMHLALNTLQCTYKSERWTERLRDRRRRPRPPIRCKILSDRTIDGHTGVVLRSEPKHRKQITAVDAGHQLLPF